MAIYQFRQWQNTQNTLFGSQEEESKVGTVINNLMVHIPAEAVALVTLLTPLVHVGPDHPEQPWLLIIGGLLVTVVVRWVANASAAVWVTTLLAFILWMSLVPAAGPAVCEWLKGADHQIDIAILAAIFSAVVTVLATAGKLK